MCVLFRYVNRYGPGMVIYWFGYLSDLNNHPDVLLTDKFPAEEDIIRLSMPQDLSSARACVDIGITKGVTELSPTAHDQMTFRGIVEC